MRKKNNKKSSKIKATFIENEKGELIDVKVEVTDVGEVLPLTADEDNPASDGKEFVGGEEDE